MKWILETKRLKLREIIQDDFDSLYLMLSCSETMSFYPAPYTKSDVQQFIDKNLEWYKSIRCGLWAIILKSKNTFIGDCGITIQDIDGKNEYEIGYHLNKDYWGNGYAIEAAQAVKEYGFQSMRLKKLCSYMASDHWSSRKVAERNDMALEKTIHNPQNRDLPTVVYTIYQ
ncbi:MAG: GNAT family N-acetyltransferase [Candidatus Marinimicrobia bacterium]|nr:GNAT family N-acetyltransferase [Candidatus Neomarinimicrobiota bacterium]MBL7009750.1 GNAT family N-acetyltransferase [Candidatus Neomarinimicrobiota bacterium]MBL7029846.1 GNAT family N-acetyltransferase [Candidatus Neomarinimicrobiota bacterium]